jgi:HSP20 family protein
MVSRYLAPFRPGGAPTRDPFLQLHREMNRLFDDTFRGFGGGQDGGAPMSVPQMDIHEQDNRIEITAELPGVSQDDIELDLDGDMLTLKGEKRNQRQDKQAHVSERSYGSFYRSVQLPFAPDPDQVTADFKEGVLTVSIPRNEQQERRRRIAIGGTAQQGQGEQRTIDAGQGDDDRGAFSFSGNAEERQREQENAGAPADT